MKLTIELELDNSAFESEYGGINLYEVDRVLHEAVSEIAKMVREFNQDGSACPISLRDVNGNKAGRICLDATR